MVVHSTRIDKIVCVCVCVCVCLEFHHKILALMLMKGEKS